MREVTQTRQDELREVSIEWLSDTLPENRNMGPAEKFLKEMFVEAIEEICHEVNGTYLMERLAEELEAKTHPVTLIPLNLLMRSKPASLADWFRATHPDAKCVQVWRAQHGG
jgi:hypothetical protein